MEKETLLLIVLFTLETQSSYRWDKWSWSMLQPHIASYRRNEHTPQKTLNSECKCSPNTERPMEYKLNKLIVDLSRRSLAGKNATKLRRMKQGDSLDDAWKSDMKRYKGFRFRRHMSDEESCCPRELQMPTFITNKKFDELVGWFDKKKVPPQYKVIRRQMN